MKTIGIGICACGALLLMASCAGGEKKVDTQADGACVPFIQLENYGYASVAEVTDADSSDIEGWKYCKVSGEGVMPVSIGGKDVAGLRDSLERLAKVTFASEKTCEPRLDADMKLTSLPPDSTPACGVESNRLTVDLVTPRVAVWRNYRESYDCGAAHGTYNTTFVNYSVSDGRILSVADLMKPGYEMKLTALLRDKVLADKVDLIVPADKIGIPADFRITDSGISFLYGLYEIAPYSSGEIQVDFDGYDLRDILRSEAMALIYGPVAD